MVALSDKVVYDYQNTEPVESKCTSPSKGDCQEALLSNIEASSLLLLIIFILTHVTISIQVEVADILPSKIIPIMGWGVSGKCTHSKPVALVRSFNIQPISHTVSICSNNDVNETHKIVAKPMVWLELSLPHLILTWWIKGYKKSYISLLWDSWMKLKWRVQQPWWQILQVPSQKHESIDCYEKNEKFSE